MVEKVEDTNLIGILVALFVIILTFVLFVLYRRRKSFRNCILITGLCDSGKTLLFSQLLYKKLVNTHTSIKENVDGYTVNNKYLKVVDIPGHERLRDKFLESYKELTRGIIFVVDGATIQQDIRDVAEYLYNILVDPTIVKNSPEILILCNKQDQTLAKGSKAVKGSLEKELNTLRVTKSRQLDSVDPKSRKSGLLGAEDKELSFSSLGFNITFGESCALNKDGSINLQEVQDWLVKVA